MFTHGIKLMSIGKYSENINETNVLKNLLITIMNIDIWILINTKRCLIKLIKIFKPIFECLFIMSLGAGLLLTYGLIFMSDNHDNVNVKSKYSMPEITDVSHNTNTDITFIERELIRLRNKALNLELSFNKMNIKLQSMCKYEKVLNENSPDFASEAAGGSVIDTPHTKSFYDENQYQMRIFGIPLWRPNYFTPRKIIQPWTQAGECWAFRGSNGNIEIELAYLTLINRVTLEHIPISASLTGSIDSAPREFRVLGKFRNKYLLLGTYIYIYDGAVSQTFSLTNEELKNTPFRIIMLQIISNWGNPEYTCIYRFKVHGKIYNHSNESLSPDKRNKNE